MKKILQSLEGLSFIVYLFGIFYIVLKNKYLSVVYDLPDYFLPTIALLGIIYVIYRYLKLYIKINRLESEFTAIVNHTFRTPLTRIIWLAKELEKDKPQRERLLLIQNLTNATNRMIEIVDLFAGIKDINDVSSYFFEAISIREIIEKSITKYREEINKKNIIFHIPTFNGVPLITMDIKKISFVVDALIENAIFYTPNNGKISIDYMSQPKKITLLVSDTGIGLSLMDKIRIFSKFYRNKEAILKNPNGMGLKLYLAKQIIRSHRGRIYVKSKGRNKGSTFFLELPFSK